MPISRQVRATRLAVLHEHRRYPASIAGLDREEELHGLHDRDLITGSDDRADFHERGGTWFGRTVEHPDRRRRHVVETGVSLLGHLGPCHRLGGGGGAGPRAIWAGRRAAWSGPRGPRQKRLAWSSSCPRRVHIPLDARVVRVRRGAEAAEPPATLVPQFPGGAVEHSREFTGERGAQRAGCLGWRVVRAAGRLRYDTIHDAEPQQLPRVDA